MMTSETTTEGTTMATHTRFEVSCEACGTVIGHYAINHHDAYRPLVPYAQAAAKRHANMGPAHAVYVFDRMASAGKRRRGGDLERVYGDGAEPEVIADARAQG